MSNNKQKMDDIKAAAINTCLEMEMAFKLYSYRVIDHETFLARVQDLCKYFLETSEDEGTGTQEPPTGDS